MEKGGSWQGVESVKLGLGSGISVFAMMIAVASPAWAQQQTGAGAGNDDAGSSVTQNTAEQAEGDSDEIIVSGIRESLANAQQTKRNADTFVDSISAQDIGALPDRSVAEALQRVPGVTISRFAAGTDPSRFNQEGGAVLIRGLNKTRSEFNGRDSFSANTGDGRGLSFEDITPEILAAVDVYKNQTADMIEGGIAGTINIRTRLPFDQPGSLFALSGDISYGDLRQEATPTISGLISHRWETGIGDIGILLNGAYSELKTQVDGVLIESYFRENGLRPGQTLLVPADTEITTQNYDRKREGRAAALQWRSLDESVELTLQYFYSKGKERARQRNVNLDANPGALQVFPGTQIEVDGDTVTSGTFIESNPYNQFFPYPGIPNNDVVPLLGSNFQTASRIQRTERETADYSANLKWKVNDRLKFNFDFQYIDSSREQLDYTHSFINKGTYSFSGVGGNEVPVVNFGLPYPGAPADYFLQPGQYIPFVTMDHIEDVQGEEYAGRFDVEYDVDSDWFESIQAGVRYAEIDQEAKWSTYNWGTINTFWNPSVAGFLDDQPQIQSEVVSISGFAHRNQNVGPYLFPSWAAMEEYTNYTQGVAAINAQQSQVGGIGRWYPAALRPGAVDGYLPGEINVTSETNKAAYLRLNFGGDLFGTEFKANLGVRYVEFENDTNGGVAFSQLSPPPLFCAGTTPGEIRQRQADARCFISSSDYAFANGNSGAVPEVGNKFNDWLPSFNLRLGLKRDMFLRFAVSKAVSRVPLGLLRNFVTVQPSQPRGFNSAGVAVDTIAGCANIPIDVALPPQCVITSAILQNATGDAAPFTANSAGNPELDPEKSWNFDASFEWYFGRDSSLTIGGFYKRLTDTFRQGSLVRSFTNNGVTRDVVFTTLTNGEKATIKGFELAYQQFFTFLPAPFDGLGFQGNYTFIDSNGRTSAIFGGTQAGGITQLAEGLDLPLTNLSKHNFNLVGIYQKEWIEARVAYTWRSRYLLTERDSVAPNLPVYSKSYGQLDASVFLNITPQFRLGVQGVNLLDSITRTTRSTSATDNAQLPRGWFSADRRFSIVARTTF